MKNFTKSLLILTFAVLVSACNKLPSTTTQTESSEITNSNTPSTSESVEIADATGGVYTDFNSSEFEANSDKVRVLFFHANWCPTCKVVNEQLEADSQKLPANVIVYKTDYDNQTSLKDKYGVTYQHTFVVVDSQGESLAKWNGGGTDLLLEKLNSL